MTLRLLYRAAQPADAPWLSELFAAASSARAFLPEDLLRLQEQAQRQQWSGRWGAGGESLVELDGVRAARVWVAWNSRELRIVDLAVHPAWRRRGVGRRLMKDLCAAADHVGAPITLTVDAANSPARALYGTLGFDPDADAGQDSSLSIAMRRAPMK